MKFMKDMNGVNCGQKLKKLAKIYFYVFFALMLILAVIGVLGFFASAASGNAGTAFGILLLIALYIGLLCLIGFMAYLNMYANGNMVEIQEKQYTLLQDLYQKLYDDGTLTQNTDDKLEF